MGYGGLKLGTHNSSALEKNLQRRNRVDSFRGEDWRETSTRMNKEWDEQDHVRLLRDVRELIARGPPVEVASSVEDQPQVENTEGWQEKEGRLRLRETLQKFSNWICEERASRMNGDGKAHCQNFESFDGSSFRGNDGSVLCKMIYERERERCKVTHGTMVDPWLSAQIQPTQRRTQRRL